MSNFDEDGSSAYGIKGPVHSIFDVFGNVVWQLILTARILVILVFNAAEFGTLSIVIGGVNVPFCLRSGGCWVGGTIGTRHGNKIIDQAWLGVTTRTLTSAWKKLWPEAVAERIYEELEPGMSVEEEIVSGEIHGSRGGRERRERARRGAHPGTEEIQELQSQQHTEVMQKIGFEESEEKVISTSEIKEILGMWERVSQFVEKKHPEKVATGRASDLFNDTCLTHFWNILRGRKKQTSLDMFFSKRPTGEREKNVAKKTKTSEDI
ncbi:tigger transposable element-derived protein 1 [Nephila pilipes]|uniref:Tigger transposable element-derived protein 1 n=1 Tax=Nephila pilipes TaxID=299642 RepID=A0A8X6QU10_NEPPI|nr:tigger transposable element-derived protein 1 [Nephila pilipes]